MNCFCSLHFIGLADGRVSSLCRTQMYHWARVYIWFCQVSAVRSGLGSRTFQNSLLLLANINCVGRTLTPWGSSKVHITWAVCVRHLVHNTCHSNVHFPRFPHPFNEQGRSNEQIEYFAFESHCCLWFFPNLWAIYHHWGILYSRSTSLPFTAKLTLLLCGWVGVWSQYRFCPLMSSQQSELRKRSQPTPLLALPRPLGCPLH